MSDEPRLRVGIIGGTGHVGRRVTRSFRDRGHEVTATSRRGRDETRVLDLQNPGASAELFEEFAKLDALVDCSDSVRVSPVHLVRAFAERGIRTPIFQASADPHRLAELTEEYGRIAREVPPVVIGVGVYPGLSNLLAARLVEELGDVPQALDVHLSWSIWSAAGSGTCALMVEALSKPLRGWKDGRLLLCDPIEDVVRMPHFAGMSRWGLQVGFPEIEILQHSTGASTVRTIMAPRPGVPWAVLSSAQWAARHGLFRPAISRAALLLGFRTLRQLLLRGRRTGARIAVRAESRDRTGTVVVDIADAFEAAAHGTVAIVEECIERGVPDGLRAAEEVAGFDAVATRVRDMGTILEAGPFDLTQGTSRVL